MSLKPEPIGSIPPETVRVAKASFPAGNTFMKMRDEIGILYHDKDFTEYITDVTLDCMLTDHQLLGNGCITLSFSDEA